MKMDFELIFLLYPFIIFAGNTVVKCEPKPGKYTDSGILDPEIKDKKVIAKRYGVNFDSCSANFAIHRDKIIRTEDSIKMGAKYLNANDVSTRDQCLKICCQTDTCNVFVFEEKSPGTCYIFNCGSPDDFKCNFTHHHNYSSAVLTVKRPLIELESQIPHSQHEQELLRLRKPETPNIQVVETTTPIVRKGSKEILPTAIEFAPPSGKCSRYQFECRSTGECTAIYNACDGIPQCPDGSDEAPELGCPTTAPTAVPIVSLTKTQVQVGSHSFSQNKPATHVDMHSDKTVDPSRQFSSVNGIPSPVQNPQQMTWQQQMYNNPNVNMMPNGLEPQAMPVAKSPEQQMEYKMPEQLINQAKTYGREGENFQWQESMPKGDMHIFTHKGGLMTNYQPSESVNPVNGPQYGEISSSNINYYNNAGYGHLQPQPAQPNWHRKAIPPEINVNPAGYDYFYEDPRARLQQQAHPNSMNSFQHQPSHFQQSQDVEPMLKAARRPADSVKKANPVDILLTTEMPSSTTVKHKVHSHHTHHKPSASHRKVEKFGAETNLKILEEDMEQRSVPSGAILSLTLGLLVTALMVVIVGCRMRVIRRRLRRGGKSGYSHDADFLVNGMYL